MKRTLFLSALFFMLAVQVGWGQIPKTISYQGVLTDSNGVVLNGTYDLTFNLYDAETGGNLVWEETYQAVEVNNGIFNVILGGKQMANNFAFDREYWLGVTVNGEELSRIPLTTSPYSFGARGVYGGSNIFPFIGSVGIGTTEPTLGAILDVKGISLFDSIRVNGDLHIKEKAAFQTQLDWPQPGDNILHINPWGDPDTNVEGVPDTGYDLVSFNTNGQAPVHINGDSIIFGNVGIGTTYPEAKLHVNATGLAGFFNLNNENSASPALSATTNGRGIAIKGFNSGISGPGGSFEITSSQNSSPALRVKTIGNGYAGLFNNNIRDTATLYVANAAENGIAAEFKGRVYANNAYFDTIATTRHALFETSDDSEGVALSVLGGSAINGILIGTDVTWNDRRNIDYPFEYETVGVTSPSINLRLQSPSSIIFHTGDSLAERMAISKNGDVGIGTTNPGARLDVDGDLKMKGELKLDEKSGFLTELNHHLHGNILHINPWGDPDTNIPDAPDTGYDLVSINTNGPAPVYINGDLITTGTIRTTEIEVTATPIIPDFVFEDDYKLMPLDALEQSIQQNKHLPDIPSAEEIAANGMNIGEMQAKLLQKVEELTLYMIELKKENEQLKHRVAALEN
jgi:hypothetical protein